MAAPGRYTVTLALRHDGQVTTSASQTFDAEPPTALAGTSARDRGHARLPPETSRLQRAVLGAVALVNETQQRLTQLKRAIDAAPSDTRELAATARTLEQQLADLRIPLSGDASAVAPCRTDHRRASRHG